MVALNSIEDAVLAQVQETVRETDAAVEMEPAEGEHGALIHVLPTDPAAAKLTVHVTSDTDVDVWIGPYGAPVDILARDTDELLERLAEIIRAVSEGRVEVRAKVLKGHCLASTVVLGLDSGPRSWFASTLFGLLLPLPRKHEGYAPYRLTHA